MDGAVHEQSDLDIAVLFDRRPPGLDERGEEEATVAYYESLTPDERREDAAMATASSRAARHLAVDRVPAAGRRQRRKR